MIHLHTAINQHALEIAIADWKLEVPADRSQDDLCRELPPSERFPLGSGFWKSLCGGRTSAYLNERGRRILAALDDVAARKDASLAEVALAWLMARSGLAGPSATNLEQMKDLAAATRQRLDAAEVEQLDEVSAWTGTLISLGMVSAPGMAAPPTW